MHRHPTAYFLCSFPFLLLLNRAPVHCSQIGPLPKHWVWKQQHRAVPHNLICQCRLGCSGRDGLQRAHIIIHEVILSNTALSPLLLLNAVGAAVQCKHMDEHHIALWFFFRHHRFPPYDLPVSASGTICRCQRNLSQKSGQQTANTPGMTRSVLMHLPFPHTQTHQHRSVEEMEFLSRELMHSTQTEETHRHTEHTHRATQMVG